MTQQSFGYFLSIVSSLLKAHEPQIQIQPLVKSSQSMLIVNDVLKQEVLFLISRFNPLQGIALMHWWLQSG